MKNSAFWSRVLSVRPKMNGDCLRILIFLTSQDKQCRLSEIESAVGISKENASRYCTKLYKDGYLKKYEKKIGKLKYPLYSIKWSEYEK